MAREWLGPTGRVRRVGGLVLCWVLVAVMLVGCGRGERSTEAFCEQLATSTGPEGAEVIFATGDPEMLTGVTSELRELFDRAPDDIATTVSTMIDFFDDYQRAPRDDRRDLLVERQAEMAAASERFSSYAVDRCGLLLQRAVPTPIADADPGVDARE